MAETINTAEKGPILKFIEKSILAGKRCYDIEDVDSNLVLANLRQSKRHLEVIQVAQNFNRPIIVL